MQPRKMKFTFVQINMKRASYCLLITDTALNRAYGSQESLVSQGKSGSKFRGGVPTDEIIQEEEEEI